MVVGTATAIEFIEISGFTVITSTVMEGAKTGLMAFMDPC